MTSIIIPIYDPERRMADMVSRCLESVIGNSKPGEYELIPIVDVKGFSRAVNLGISRSRGEHIIVLNSDTEVRDPDWIEKLRVENKISSWRLHPFFITGRLVPDGACWGISRRLWERLGNLDEQFVEGYGFEDSDYWMRAEQAGIAFHDAGIYLVHYENKTFQAYYAEEKEQMTQKNEVLFREKWKERLSL